MKTSTLTTADGVDAGKMTVKKAVALNSATVAVAHAAPEESVDAGKMRPLRVRIQKKAVALNSASVALNSAAVAVAHAAGAK